MATEVIERWMPTSLRELRDALDDALSLAASEGDGTDPDTLYVDMRDFALVRQTLTDGSVAHNLVVRETR